MIHTDTHTCMHAQQAHTWTRACTQARTHTRTHNKWLSLCRPGGSGELHDHATRPSGPAARDRGSEGKTATGGEEE